jgi:hypothetical protein
LGAGLGNQIIVRDNTHLRKQLLALLVLAPTIAGCSGASDLLSGDSEWFSHSGRLFIRNVSIDAPPLMPNRPVTADDLVSAEGACPGMTPPGNPADANANANANTSANAPADAPAGSAPPPVTTGTVALGHTECDVVRGIGAPDNVNISSGPGGQRVAVVTWTQGPRAGIYTFRGGRLHAVERAPEPAAPTPKTAKSKTKKKRPAAT